MTPSASRPSITVVHNDQFIREAVLRLLREEGMHVDMFDAAERFLEQTSRETPDCLIVDLVLPGMSGLDLHEELVRLGRNPRTILVAGNGDVATAVRAIKAGASDFLTNPFDTDALLAAVQRAVSDAETGRLARSRRAIAGMVGRSQALERVLSEVEFVADTDATVLITGESGTGKELVARALHAGSRRRHGPLVRVNCAAIPETLFESDLFGYVRGAFTGALTDRPGRFEAAQGGSLLLDEIGEVPLTMQSKLLRVLQEKEFERVGETRPRKSDVRIVAATNRNLAEEVAAGRFRGDLFYRLNVFPIHTPALRERREDIPLLAEHFVQAAARRFGRPPLRLGEPALRHLMAREWPGNIRELENVIERAVILARDGHLRFDGGVPATETQRAAPATVLPQLSRGAMATLQRETIAAALERSRGRVSGSGGAAELLGMKPTTLYSRIAALGLRRSRGAPPSAYASAVQ